MSQTAYTPATPLPASFFTDNRCRLTDRLPDGALAVLVSNDRQPTNADGHFAYRPGSDLYYLTGIEQEGTRLILFPGAARGGDRQILFIARPDPLREKWEGRMLTREQARALSGIESIEYSESYEGTLRRLALGAGSIYLNQNEHKRAHVLGNQAEDRLIGQIREQFPLHPLGRLAPHLAALRAIKADVEVDQLRAAVRLTGLGLERVAARLAPGVQEYELEAELHHTFRGRGGRMAGYEPIIASGSEATILHYTANNRQCHEGELVLLDFGAGHGLYHADMSRVLPVSGRFTDRQRQVYQALVRIFKSARTMMRPGVRWAEWQAHTEAETARELANLGLLTSAEADDRGGPGREAPVRRYFYHGVGHMLGLDVHDVGDMDAPFVGGQVLTCEPGLYIAEEGMGLRLENNILITEAGPVDLMEEAGIPLEADEIEALMARR